MSIATMTSRRLPKPNVVEEVHVEVRPDIVDSGTLVWGQVNELLRTSLDRSGFRQPNVELIEKGYGEMEGLSLIVVARGIAVEANEYEERYGGIDLEYYREHMSAELFRAFVRRIGSIKGRADMNIGESVDTLEI
jgi:hypothetical protein